MWLPAAGRIAGALLVVSGAYLVYYWARVRFGPAATLADDPIVGVVTRFTAQLQSSAEEGRLFFAVAGIVVAVALAATVARRSRSRRRRSSTATLVGQ